MPFETLFPVWDKLTPEQQRIRALEEQVNALIGAETEA